jgi:flavorubredoxin
MAIEVAKDLFWVGVVDWSLRHFHGHELSTHRGSTYNCFLIKDEKTALVDTVWAPFAGQYIQQLKAAVDLARIDYIIVNHAEPDHSGALPELVRLCPNAQLICSTRGADSLAGLYHADWKLQTVKTGQRLPLGRRQLTFIEAPMLHWPDSMFTHLSDGILLPNDAFGQHYATAFRFNDQVDQEELHCEALKYYANILAPFSAQVLSKIDELLKLNLPVSMILPSHGVMWRQDPLQIVRKYQEWASQRPQKRATILYDTMWEGTRRMADVIGEGLADEQLPYKAYHTAVTDRNDVIADLLLTGAVIVGSPTQNRGLMPSVASVLEDLLRLGFKNKQAAAFGTYGWSGECVKLIEERLAACKFPLAAPGVRAKWMPTDQDLVACRELGRKLALAVQAG